MTSNKTRTALVLATVLIGLSGGAGGGGTQTSAPATSAGASPSMSMEPSAPAGSTSGQGSGAANAAATITISNFAYEIPGAVAPGAEVKVINMDTAEHTVTADQNATLFDVEVKENGGTATFKAPSEPGTYALHCNYHPNMHGSLTVK